MRYLITAILLIFAPLSWGEDVYYCAVEHDIELAPTESGGAYEIKRYRPNKFTFKYEADLDRLAIKGDNWGGDKLIYLDCTTCLANVGAFRAQNEYAMFTFQDDRFNFAASYFFSVDAKTGTCSKF